MTCFRHRSLWLTVLIAALAHGDEPAPPAVFPAESKPTAARIEEARKLLAADKWTEAVDEVQAVLTASGDDLVAVSPGRCVECRRLCHSLLAGLPPDALRSYRERVDPSARKWLDQGEAERDVRLLRKVIDEAFCSRSGEKALDLLGDVAFERGDFEEAELWWGLLLPPRASKGPAPAVATLAYPDPRIDPARTRAKILLARLFRGAVNDVQAYRKENADAEGALAGKKGRYADLLQQIAEERNADAPAPTMDWPTFGGDAARGQVAVGPPRLLERLGALCRPQNERQFSLQDRKPRDEDPIYDRGAGALLANRSMAVEPVIADGKAIVADTNFVTAYDLRTGAVEPWHDAHLKTDANPDLKFPYPPDLRCTLTVAGDRVYARLGTQTVRDAPVADKEEEKDKAANKNAASLLVCLSLKPARNGDRFRWSIDATTLENLGSGKTYAVFEGSPLVHDGRLYIASTHFEKGRPVTRVHCYPSDAREQPAELWHQDICETREFSDKDRRYRHHMLTLAGPYLVYCSHSGAVAALDAVTGKPAWAVRYPSRGDKTADGDPSPRDLAPCLFAGGRLYAAPADYDRLLCLDPATGETLWERGPIEVVQLLGVGENRLIFTTPTGLRAVGADDGVDAWALPDGGGGLPPAGRGLLIGDLVLWPTASKGPGSIAVYAVRQRDGEQPDDPSALSYVPAGNLIYADGCLLSADRQTLTIFTPPGMRLPEKERESRTEPESATAALGVARAEADAGLTDRALKDYDRAEHLGAALSPVKRKRLGETVRNERHALLLVNGRSAAAARRWDEAEGLFKQASAAEFSAPLRLQALLETAALWKTAGQPDRVAAVWLAIQSTNDFRGLTVEDATRLPQNAAVFAAGQSGGIQKRPDPPARDRGPPPLLLAEPPYSRTWQAAFDPGETALSIADDLFLCAQTQPAEGLSCRSADAGKVRWRTALPFTPTWAARQGDLIVAAGAGGAAGLRVDDGRVAWDYPAPPASRTFAAETGTVLAPGNRRADSLDHFQLLTGRVYFVQGERRLFALDAKNGRVLWVHRAPDAGLRQPYPDGRFFHVEAASADVLLAQTSGGRRWLIDAATGAILHEGATAQEPWPRAPVRSPEGVFVTPDADSVVLLDPASGRDLWTYTLPGVTTRTGEAPRLSMGPNALLVAWATNIGWRVQRLDRTTGKPTWDEPPLFNVSGLDVESWTQDGEAVYGVQDRVLVARSLKNGALLWEQPIAGPSGLWRTQKIGGALLAYPIEPTGAQFQFRWLFGALQWEERRPPEEKAGSGFPVLCCDAKAGASIQRLSFPVLSQAFAHMESDSGVLPRASAAERVEGRPLVHVSSHGLIVAAGGRAWGLAAK